MEITLHDFKVLLQSLKENDSGIRVLTHTGWSQDFLHIIGFIASTTDHQKRTFGGIVLSNMNESEGIMINNISAISAFELEQPWKHYQRGVVYHLKDNFTLKALILH